MPAKTQKKAPAKGSKAAKKPGELFLIDGNSLAYRAFFALPESIATHDGRPTNAIYGLASMFAKMLVDHDPAAVVVCWDAGWSGREVTYEPYKSQRKPRPDLLRDQWPHLMPLAEAFGFTNIKVDGFEADDVIASLTKRAREQDLNVMVVSGDRDVYQLVEDGVRVMTTSRGVTDTKIYDSEGVVERYGVPPELVTDLIGLKGDTSDNIPGVPGIGDKTAAQLLQEYGDLEGVLANIDNISGAKRKENLTNHAEDARVSKQLATAITDIDIELDLDDLMSKRMDRSRLREVAREFELRVILERLEEELGADFVPDAKVDEELDATAEQGSIDDLAKGDVALAIAGETWSGYDGKKLVEGECPDLAALAKSLGKRRLIGHDLKSLGGGARHGLLAAADGLDLRHDTMIGAYLLDPARRTYDLIDIAAQRGLAAAPKDSDGADGDQLELEKPPPDPAAEARLVWEIAQLQRKGIEEGGLEQLMDEVEMPLIEVLASMEQNGVLLDQKRLADIGEGFEQRIETLQAEIFELAGHDFTIGSPQQLAEVLFDELALTKKRRGKTGFSTDARVLSQIREEHEIVAKVEQWRELTKLKSTYLDALPELIDPTAAACTPPSTRPRPPPAASPAPTPTSRTFRSAPRRDARSDPLRRAARAPPSLCRLQPDRAAHPGPHRRRGRAPGDLRPRRGHSRGHGGGGPRLGPEEGQPRRAIQGEDGQLRNRLRPLRVRPGRPPQHRAGGGRGLHRPLLRALPGGQELHRGDDRVRQEGGLRQHAARPAPPDPGAPLGPATGAGPGRAARRQHADPGNLGGHHQDRDGRRPAETREVRPRDPPRPPDPRRAPLRGPDR